MLPAADTQRGPQALRVAAWCALDLVLALVFLLLLQFDDSVARAAGF